MHLYLIMTIKGVLFSNLTITLHGNNIALVHLGFVSKEQQHHFTV
ncbi:Uncharacterised protein [Vibrio cholerae]|nr:Uncharacterised protein [Vibrio cholerae]